MKEEQQLLWDNWHSERHYGDLMFRRASGEVGEMYAARAVSKIINEFYKPGMKVLDVGCGAGHYLLSLRKIIDPDIDYTGIDPTKYYLELAEKAFGGTAKFKQGGLSEIPFNNHAFDIVICNHVILHLPPDMISRAFAELIRVAKYKTVTRTAFGERNYIIREILNHNDLDPVHKQDILYSDFDLSRHRFRYFNMYTPEFIRQLILAGNKVKVEIRDDRDYEPFDNTGLAKIKTATRTIGDMQVSGNLILDYKFVITEKEEAV